MNRRKASGRGLWTALALFCSCAALTYSTLALSGGEGFLNKPLLLLLNALPILLVLLLSYFATGRAWLALLLTTLLVLPLALVNHYKLLLRNDPLLLCDLLLIGEAQNITGRYDITLDAPVMWSALIPVLLMGLLLWQKRLFARPRRAARLILPPILIGLLVFVGGVWYPSDAMYEKTGASSLSALSPTASYTSRGMLYPFLHSIGSLRDEPPEGYDEAEVRALLSAYQDEDMPLEKKIAIVSVMLEAYNDFSTFEGVALTRDVYAPLHELQARGYSGRLVTNLFAGGTVDTERCFLTGLFQTFSPRAKASSLIWYLRDQGYFCEGYHPWYSWFYNRVNVNEHLGFDRYSFLEQAFTDEAGKPITSDENFFDQVYEGFRSGTQGGQPYFSFNISYQNHGPYPSAKAAGEPALKWRDGYAEKEYNIMNQYLLGIEDTTKRLYGLVQRLEASDTPAVLIAFGDHNPWLGDGCSVYKMLGIDLDTGTAEGFYNYYATPYLILANTAAKRALGCEMTGDGGETSAAFLLPTLFQLAGMKGSALMQYLYDLHEKTAYINCQCYEQGGAPVPEKAAQDAFIREARCVEYALQHGVR